MLKVIFILERPKVKELRVPFVMYSFHEIHTHTHTHTHAYTDMFYLNACVCIMRSSTLHYPCRLPHSSTEICIRCCSMPSVVLS